MIITTDEKIREIKREIGMRKTVYKIKVRDGAMSPQEASHRIKVMEAILEDYQAAHEPRFPDSY